MSEPDAPRSIDAVLFDLDGTFADTAPDLAHALNHALTRHGRSPLALARIRPWVSHGAQALIRGGFDLGPEDAGFAPRRQALLDYYRRNICRDTRLFDGMQELLSALNRRGVCWGIVTNKPAYLTDPLMQALGQAARAACIVSGDTTAHSKPHPEPILHACREAGAAPERCLYVGDAQRDIEAGKAAGARTLVAAFGYIAADDRPETWGADGSVAHPCEILDWL